MEKEKKEINGEQTLNCYSYLEENLWQPFNSFYTNGTPKISKYIFKF